MKINAPMINDITTDFDNPPGLDHGRPYKAKFKDLQKKYYSEIKPIIVNGRAPEIFQQVEQMAQLQSSWEEIEVYPEKMRITAIAVTSILRFKDDLAIEVRERSEELTEIHMRSQSRLGRSDLGANAKRIKSFFDQINRALNL